MHKIRNTPIYLELSTYETNNYCGNHNSLIKVYIIIAIYFKMENIKPRTIYSWDLDVSNCYCNF